MFDPGKMIRAWRAIPRLSAVTGTLVAASAAIALLKISVWQVSPGDVLPHTQYSVRLTMRLDGNDDSVVVRSFLPASDVRQEIRDERVADASLSHAVVTEGLNRKMIWTGRHVQDGVLLSMSVDVMSRPIAYDIDPGLELPPSYPLSIARYLKPAPNIQVDSPEIEEELERIGADHGTILERLGAIHTRTSSLAARPFKGTTDALTALRLGEASCNGKSRLFVALARQAGIPARLVGGLVMKTGTTRTTHQWVECYVGGHWVPFDPTNGYFARLPGHYLELYTGDEVLFTHTRDINFEYQFWVSTELVPSSVTKGVFGSLNVWGVFERSGLPFSLLRTLLTLPVGALVVVLCRNVVGVPTWGTFLPALLAAAMAETGLFWGLLSWVAVIAVAGLLRSSLQDLNLLHAPLLAILLAFVAVTLMGVAVIADFIGNAQLSRATIFPIAVTAISAERFYMSISDDGMPGALKRLAGTAAVILACYLVMNSLAVQMLLVAFPEVLLVVVALELYLGRWVGIRLSEYFRFRGLLIKEAG